MSRAEDAGLRGLKDGVWILAGPNNIGFVEDVAGIYLIDSGNDKESGRRIKRILKMMDWQLAGIINTHSNADHIGGNDYLQRNLNCPIWASPVENAFIEYPELQAAFLWGGFPIRELNSKLFRAKPSVVTNLISDENNRVGEHLSLVNLPGHFFNMIGLQTDNGVLFLGDALFGEEVLMKYKLPFIYDVKAFKETIDRIMTMDAELFVPTHGRIRENIRGTGAANLDLVEKIEGFLLDFLEEKRNYDAILKGLCDHLGISLDYKQFVLVGSTVRSFLSFLHNSGRIEFEFLNNILNWRRI